MLNLSGAAAADADLVTLGPGDHPHPADGHELPLPFRALELRPDICRNVFNALRARRAEDQLVPLFAMSSFLVSSTRERFGAILRLFIDSEAICLANISHGLSREMQAVSRIGDPHEFTRAARTAVVKAAEEVWTMVAGEVEKALEAAGIAPDDARDVSVV